MDKKTTSSFRFKTTVKKAPLGQRAEPNGSKPNVQNKTLLSTKTAPKGIAKNVATAKPKTFTSTIGRTATSKEKLEANLKKKNEYISKINEFKKEIASCKESLENMPPLSEDQEALEEIKSLLKKEEEQYEEQKKLFNRVFLKRNELAERVEMLEEKHAEDMKLAGDLKMSLIDGGRKILKQERELQMLIDRRENNEVSLDALKKDHDNFQKANYELFLDNRNLANEIFELKGSAQVFCRMRPRLEEEDRERCYEATFDNSSITVSTNNYKLKRSKKEFNFDRIFTPRSSIGVLFEEMHCFIKSAIGGTSVFIFLYGPPRSGKNYTLNGLLEMMGDFLFDQKRKIETMGWNLEIILQLTEFDEEENVLCRKKIETGEDLVDTYLLSKENLKTSKNPLVLQIIIDGKSSCHPEKICSVITITKVSSDASLAQTEIRKTMLAVAQKETPDQDDSSHFSKSLLSNWEENCKSLTILHLSPAEDQYSDCLNVMKFGTDIMAGRSKQKKQK